MSRTKANEMHALEKNVSLEDQKFDLIKLRIKNKFYDKDDVYEKLISELIQKELRREL